MKKVHVKTKVKHGSTEYHPGVHDVPEHIADNLLDAHPDAVQETTETEPKGKTVQVPPTTTS